MTDHVHDVLVIGGGISGVGTVIAMRDAGFDDVRILERADTLGGTWRDNTYPGCACDIPSSLYSYSFEPNPDWSHVFARRGEIQAYVLDVVEKYRVDDSAECGVEVLDAAWDDATQTWDVETSAGRRRGRALVVAAGPLHEPVMPDGVPASAFKGTSWHSSRWNHEHSLKGERVAVIGTGASAVQFVPYIQRDAAKVTVFQRTPGWVMPKPDWRVTKLEKRLFRRFPITQRAVRAGLWGIVDFFLVMVRYPRLARLGHVLGKWNIRRGVKDPAMRRALTPDYTIGCKRAMVSNHYYQALGKPNVELVAQPISDVREGSVVAADGTEHEVDTIIWATGFHVSDLPIAERVRGRDGRSMAEVWQGHPRALYGTSVTGFPNAFMIFGPNIGTGSAFVMVENQLAYIVGAMQAMRDAGVGSIDVRREAVDAFKHEVEERLAGSVFHSGCSSYYLDATGKNYSVWPGTMLEMKRRLGDFDLAAYDVEPAVAVSTNGSAPVPAVPPA
jgi:cation diffusion facilitator CzcD-associated flavoprotein CzcO